MVGRTTVVVAHRLSTVKNADKIVVLESGHVMESGTHEELVAVPGGRYRKMVSGYSASAYATPTETVTYVAEVISDLDVSEIACSSESPGESSQQDYADNGLQEITITSPVNSKDFAAPTSDMAGSGAAAEQNTSSAKWSAPPDLQDPDGVHQNASDPMPGKAYLWQLTAREATALVFGCAGSAMYGAVLPLFGFLLGSIMSDLYILDPQLLQQRANFWCLIILCVGKWSSAIAFKKCMLCKVYDALQSL